MNAYNPGLHIVSTFSTDQESLENADAGKLLFDSLIEKYGLQKVGEVYHSFPNAGFTAVVCLTESHLSIHTWPEHGLATFDVFLSNFFKDNSEKVRGLYQDVLHHFKAVEINKQEIQR